MKFLSFMVATIHWHKFLFWYYSIKNYDQNFSQMLKPISSQDQFAFIYKTKNVYGNNAYYYIGCLSSFFISSFSKWSIGMDFMHK